MFRAISCSVLTLALCDAAFAQGRCPEQDRVEANRTFREVRDSPGLPWDQAMNRLRHAYDICPECHLPMAMGELHEREGRLVEALASYRACTERFCERAEWTAACRAKVAELAERLKKGRIAPSVKPAGARVLVGGVDMTPAPGSAIETAPGPREVEVRAPGFVPFRTVVDVKGGMEVPLVVELKPEPGTPVVARPVPEREARRGALWNWVGVGAGGALLATGAGFTGSYLHKIGQAGEGQWVTKTDLAIGIPCAVVGAGLVVTSILLWP